MGAGVAAAVRNTVTQLGGLLVNRVTGEARIQGGNRFGYLDWPGLVEWSHSEWSGVTEEQARGLPGIGRGIQILTNVVSSLTPQAYRDETNPNAPTTLLPEQPALLGNPWKPWHTRDAWTEALVDSLAMHGNGFADRVTDVDWRGYPKTLPLIPAEHVWWDRSSGDWKVNGKLTPFGDLWHVAINVRAGHVMGRGILAQYQRELKLMLAVERAQAVVMDGANPVGVLFLDADVTADELGAYKQAFMQSIKRDGMAAMTKGNYQAIGRSAADLTMIPTREYQLRTAAIITGCPGWMLGVPNTSRVYSNAETEWANYLRITIARYLGAVESGLSACLPGPQTVRYNIERALLRGDTTARWRTYEVATRIGAMTVEEIRQAEGWSPLPTPALEPANDQDPAAAEEDAA